MTHLIDSFLDTRIIKKNRVSGISLATKEDVTEFYIQKIWINEDCRQLQKATRAVCTKPVVVLRSKCHGFFSPPAARYQNAESTEGEARSDGPSKHCVSATSSCTFLSIFVVVLVVFLLLCCLFLFLKKCIYFY